MLKASKTPFLHKERYKDIQKVVSNQSKPIFHLIQASRHVEFTSSLLIIISYRFGIEHETLKALIAAGRRFYEN